VPVVEQELPTLPEHLNVPPVLIGVRVTRSLMLYVLFCRLLIVSPLVLFLFTIMLSALLRFTDSDFPFDIFKLFLATTLMA
jgi:uncharacterized RDD family membrane protein YckC